ncbi:MAG: AAA family ATPase [Prevotella sp.]|jgi:ATP-dependent exoDNAse (exonuclease V) alpha subunit|nr:AAA family ATPase [Prevotella sp.]
MIYKDLIGEIKKTNRHTIIHGLAGSGKSTFIRDFSNDVKERCLKIAPTGLSAFNIDGITIESFIALLKKNKKSLLRYLLGNIDYIIIDEISMVHYYKLDDIFSINQKLERSNGYIKLIIVGDPFQLPPVVTRNMKNVYYKKTGIELLEADFYFFNSKQFNHYLISDKFQLYYLNANLRQADNAFSSALAKIAMGTADQKCFEYFNKREYFNTTEIEKKTLPLITTTKKMTDFFNSKGLSHCELFRDHMPIIEKIYEGYSEVSKENKHLLEPFRYAANIPIVFIQNDPEKKWRNGTRGMIKSIFCSPEAVDILLESDELVKCFPTQHKVQRLVYNEKTKEVKSECVAIIRRFPFILGFALTVHRCQGMTLEKLTFNVGHGCFASGQLYVALSRVRNINDLTLETALIAEDMKTEDNVKEYFERFLMKSTIISE